MRAAILNVTEHSNELSSISDKCKLPHPLDEYVIKLDRLYRESITSEQIYPLNYLIFKILNKTPLTAQINLVLPK